MFVRQFEANENRHLKFLHQNEMKNVEKREKFDWRKIEFNFVAKSDDTHGFFYSFFCIVFLFEKIKVNEYVDVFSSI